MHFHMHDSLPVHLSGQHGLLQAKGRKAEMKTKLEELERDIAQLGQHSEEQVANEESAAERLSEVRPDAAAACPGKC